MKMSPELFAKLRDAIEIVGGITSEATMRQRWDTLWRAVDAGLIDINKLYYKEAGLNDDHIDTALRRIAR